MKKIVLRLLQSHKGDRKGWLPSTERVYNSTTGEAEGRLKEKKDTEHRMRKRKGKKELKECEIFVKV